MTLTSIPMRKHNVGAKIVWLVTLASTLAVVLACAVMLGHGLYQHRAISKRFITSDARLFAVHLAAPLAFSDAQTANESLSAFRSVPNLVEARLFDAEGELFASFQRNPESPPIAFPHTQRSVITDNYLLVTEPVIHDGQELGILTMAYDLEFLYRQVAVATILAIFIAAIAIGIAAAVAFRLRRTITTPVNELMRTAHEVSARQDYSVRARKLSDDEFGELTDTFNAMLERILTQDAAIRHANSELRASNEEMEQFVYTVSHDLKSPLVTITGFVGLLRQDLEAGHTEEIEDSLDHLERASRKMGELISDLLNLSRVGRMEYHMAWVDPHEVLDEVIESLDVIIEHKQVQVKIDADLPEIWADRQRLSQLFQNLLENAIKYGCPMSGLTVEVGGRRTADAVELFVKDQGAGIEAQYQDRVFGLFQRLAVESTEGTGIGLTIAKRIVESHQGVIRIESEPGQGCTFWIVLPTPPRGAATFSQTTRSAQRELA